MKIVRLLPAVTLLAWLFMLTVSTATAGGMGNGAAQRMKLVVTAVDATAGTIEITSQVDQTVHTYKIDATTKIIMVNAKGTIDQIKAGQKVANYAAEGGMPKEGQTLTLLLLSRAAPAATAPAPPATP